MSTRLQEALAGLAVVIDASSTGPGAEGTSHLSAEGRQTLEKLAHTKDLGEFTSFQLRKVDLDCEQCAGDWGWLMALKVKFVEKTLLFYVVEWEIDESENTVTKSDAMMVKVFNTKDIELLNVYELYLMGATFDKEDSRLVDPNARNVEFAGSLKGLTIKVGLPYEM